MKVALARVLAFLAGLLLAVPVAAAPEVRVVASGWQVRLAPGDAAAKAHPRAARWFAATVPGSVQTDLIAAHLLADPWKGEGERAAQWVGLANWQYRTTIDVDAATLARGHVDLLFDGLDTFATVRINGTPALQADNFYRHWRIAARPLLHALHNLIEVDLASPIGRLQPMVLAMRNPLPGSYDSAFDDEPKGRQTAGFVRKPSYHYGWDWAPRLVEIGIWQPVRLAAYDGARLDDLHVTQVHLDDDMAVLDATLTLWSDAPRTADVALTVTAPDGGVQRFTRRVRLFAGANPVTLPLDIAHPRRWWPSGYGAPDRYAVEATVAIDGAAIGQLRHDIGLRTVELRRDQDRWGRSFALVVNGVPIFAKGANLLPPDSFPARAPAARLDAVFQAAVDANMNLLRVWGGGYYLDDHAYDTADRLGLMLWQEFMFGGAVPPTDAAFVDNTRTEATEQVRRLRDHPSVVLWVGNNEVQTGWEKWDDRKALKAAIGADAQEAMGVGLARLFDRTLRDVVEREAPGTPYHASSPSTDYDGRTDLPTDGDMHYWTVWSTAPTEEYLTVTPRFMSEFGFQSMPAMATIREFLAPRTPAAIPVALKGNGYDRGRGNGRLLGYIRADYGEPRSFADYVYLSQLLQAEAEEMAAGHLRASRPQSMGALYWTLNDAWPGQINSLWTGAAWGSIDFRNRWKALHYHARRFYAPVTIVAERSAGMTAVTLVSDRTAPLAARWRLRVMDRDGALLSDRSEAATLAPLAATRVGRLADATLIGAADPGRTIALAELIVDGRTVARNLVYFAKPKALALVDPGLRTDLRPAGDGAYTLVVTTRSLARGIWIDLGTVDATLSDNAFDLAPGESAAVTIRSAAPLATLRRALGVRSLFGAARP